MARSSRKACMDVRPQCGGWMDRGSESARWKGNGGPKMRAAPPAQRTVAGSGRPDLVAHHSDGAEGTCAIARRVGSTQWRGDAAGAVDVMAGLPCGGARNRPPH